MWVHVRFVVRAFGERTEGSLRGGMSTLTGERRFFVQALLWLWCWHRAFVEPRCVRRAQREFLTSEQLWVTNVLLLNGGKRAG